MFVEEAHEIVVVADTTALGSAHRPCSLLARCQTAQKNL